MRTTTTTTSLLILATLLLAALPAAAQEQAASSRSDTTPATAEATDSDAEAAAAARRERFRRLRYGNLAEIELAGKQLRISYPDLLTDSDDYRAFESLTAGEVAAWNSGRAIKLLTHVSLSFDGIIVPLRQRLA